MLYPSYEFHRSLMTGASTATRFGIAWLSHPMNPLSHTGGAQVLASALDVIAHSTAPRVKSEFGIQSITIDKKEVAIGERVECEKAFGCLRHFAPENSQEKRPRLLIFSPMSGHFSTLLRDTVRRMLEKYDVWITDWADAKDVPLKEGPFDLDDYIDYSRAFMEHVGPGCHVMAVCQPVVPVFAAAALMSAEKGAALPASLILMGGPIDPRCAPTTVNNLATERPLAWFKHHVIETVPAIYPGAGRRVYPGFLQLTGFMSMNLEHHLLSHWRMFTHLVEGDGERADATKDFYKEYRTVCDVAAEYYLQTIDVVFQRHLLPKGEMMHRDVKIDPHAITNIAIMAIEGERDDISGIGQTKAALDISNIPQERKSYLLAKGVGHYGIFNGHKWRTQIAPEIEKFIQKNMAD